MNKNEVIIEKILGAPVEKVWKAITDKEQMKQWYFDLDEFKPEVDFEFQFAGEGHKGDKYMHLCKITEAVPLKKLTYSWRYKDYPGNSFVTFELFPNDNNTKLVLTHTGLDTFPAENPDFARDSFKQGWTEIITVSLDKFLNQ